MNKRKTGIRQTAKKAGITSNSALCGQKNSKKPKKQYDQIIFQDWCKGCGICSAFCPRKVIGRGENGKPVIERPDDCIGCRFCETHCPDFAINIEERHARPEAH